MDNRNLKLASTHGAAVLYQPAHAENDAQAAPTGRHRKPLPVKMVNAIFMLAIALAVVLMAALAGCAAGADPKLTPQVTVFTVKAGYESALTGMVAYARLPRCTPANTPVCSRQDVIDQLERARNTARFAIDAAEGAVRTPGFGSDTMATAVAAADAATKALTTFAATLPKPK